MFLSGSFIAIRSLMDMGTSSAFYTFISQRARDRKFYLYYYGWLLLQFVFTSLLITAIMPQTIIDRIWLGHSRGIILLAFLATFLQQQVWQAIGQVGDASRKTVRVQIMGLVVAIAHILIIAILLSFKMLSISIVFWLFTVEYFLVMVWSIWFLGEKRNPVEEQEVVSLSLRRTANEYWVYCRPLVFLSIGAFVGAFADRWMLQHFAGASQQGFYQISNQFAAVSLLATTSILRIFWKEIAEASALNNDARVAYLYRKVTRSLVMFSAILSGFLIPWSEQIVSLTLGKAYIVAWPVLAIMFLYPIHQSLGQIIGTMFLAKEQTRTYTLMTVIIMLVSLPVSYFVQAPTSGALIPGLGLGATGMGLKMVVFNIFSVNIGAWIIARRHNWKFDWSYQVIGVSLVIGLGYLAKFVVGLHWNFNNITGYTGIIRLSAPMLFTGVIYLSAITGLLWLMPWIAGMEREQIKAMLTRIKALFGGFLKLKVLRER